MSKKHVENTVNLEKILDELDEEILNPNTEFYSHEEIFSKLRNNVIE